MQQKMLTFIIALALIVSLSACSNETQSIEDTHSTDVAEKIDWIISPEEITVEVGEEFQIEYSPSQADRPLFYYQKENGDRETTDTRILRYGFGDLSNWDPNKKMPENDAPGFETFRATKIGTTYIFVECGENETTNRCKVNVVENIEKEVVQEETPKQPEQGVKVVLKDTLPKEISRYGSGGEKYASCLIHEASIDVSTNKIIVSLLCEKTFDFKGGASMDCPVDWKLYNSSGVVVDSGMMLKHNIAVNEKFSGEFTIYKKLDPGTYTLSFADHT